MIATEGDMVEHAHRLAVAQGFSVPLEKVMVCSSHTHSGPGAVTKKLVWKVIAVDLYRRNVADHVHDLRDVRIPLASLVHDGETGLQALGERPSTLHPAGVRRDDREVFEGQLGDRVHHHRLMPGALRLAHREPCTVHLSLNIRLTERWHDSQALVQHHAFGHLFITLP
ncbi:MAG: hypothetical protein IH797_05045 [Chloroflexi bacterium]|nr:hypothetical protein [Chloroflexota bacterium]